MKNIFKLILLVFVFFVINTSVYASNFYIKNYEVDLKVDNMKRVHITETIDTFFTTSSHGIIRKIPTPENSAIYNIKVSEHKNVEYGYSSISIKIGEASKYVTGDHRYVISYDYDIFDNKDEFYFNIIGTQWNVPINHASFRVEFPGPLVKEKTGLSIGKEGTVGFEGGATFTIGENFASGETSRILQPNEGITLRTEVPKTYFKKVKSKSVVPNFFVFVFTLVSFILWFKYGKEDKPVPVVNFYPPKNLDMLDLEIAYKGSASVHGIIATIIDLARKGYIHIYDNKKDFGIKKLKDYPENSKNKVEKDLMDGLFNGAKVGNVATKKKLRKSKVFYKKYSKLLETKNDKKEKIYDEKSNSLEMWLIMLVPVLLNALVLTLAYGNFCQDLYIALCEGIIPVIIILFLDLLIFGDIVGKENPKYPNLQKAILVLALLLPTHVFLAWVWGIRAYAIPVGYFSLLGIVISSYCMYHIPKRNKDSLKTLGDLLGLKKFIETAEKDKLEKLVEDDPEYFYAVLPYAYLLEISNKWIKKFEDIMEVNPDWFEGDSFNSSNLSNISKSMVIITTPTFDNGGISRSSGGGGGGYSSSSSSYSSSSGGGGHSGGGFGGGGGSSW